MQRDLLKRLVEWQRSTRRKPLILNGARQVGKTWLLQEFGETYFEQMAYVSLDTDEVARSLFERDLDPHRIIKELSLLTGTAIDPSNTLIVLDEIQAQPKAITALKYFCEDAPEYAIAAAGSLLGLSAHYGSGYPVGKVNTLNLAPLSFGEFLDATGNERFRQLIASGDTSLINSFGTKIVPLLKEYYVVGGMPEAVLAFIDDGSLGSARMVQSQILEDYVRDFAKHAPVRLYPRMIEVWSSIPRHLSQENKKFIFGNVRKGSRATDYEEVLTWLTEAGLITKVSRVSKPGLPLAAYDDGKAFKVFLLDVGLLGAMTGLDPKSVLDGNKALTEFKGALTEQYVCQQLISECAQVPRYWSAENSTGEIDFLIQLEGSICAIEVKAEENLRSKSLRAFKEKHPEVNALRFSLSGFREQEWMRNVPLYAVSNKDLWFPNGSQISYSQENSSDSATLE